jgi:putative ABC transport system substrate-binding protein
MRRREFITLLGGAVAAWPHAAHAQQSDRMRRIGILAGLAESDTEGQTWVRELTQRLQELGWTSGRNFVIDSRFGSLDPLQSAKMANELVELQVDVIVAIGSLAATAVRQQTLSIPIVFVQVPDPVSAGFVTNLARPEGNITGFTNRVFDWRNVAAIA